MAELLRLFVSATNDLESERAIIGRAVADLPVQIGIEIRRTPVGGARYDDIYELVANCDRVYFLMGRDITAPAGAEWQLAWQLERAVLPLRRYAQLTPAAAAFMRNAPVDWRRVRSATELARIVTMDLNRILHHPANRYGLTVTEMELLAAHSERTRQRVVGQNDDPGGAEGGGVLLDTGRREPLDGVAIGDESRR